MLFGKKQIEYLTSFMAPGIYFSLAAFVNLVYFTDWRVVAGYLPYYNGKFKGEKKEEKKSDGC